MRIWVDDIRDPREWLPNISWFRGRDPNELSEWIWIKTAQEAIALLESEQVDEISLDFDLGDPDEVGDGNHVAVWIEEKTFSDDQYIPPTIHVHSSNISGRPRLEAAIASIEKIMARRFA